MLIIAEPDDFEKLVEPLQDVARKFKSKVSLLSGSSEADFSTFLDLCN